MANNPDTATSMLQVTPQTKIGEFLENYPHLEDTLINLSPAFQKLRNPILRRTIGKVDVVGNVPLNIIINTLRQAAGQNQTNEIMDMNNNLSEKPSWFNETSISQKLDAREMLQAGQHPLAEVIRRTSEMAQGQIFELVTPFTPMPLIEKVKANGFEAFVQEVSNSETHTYFCKE